MASPNRKNQGVTMVEMMIALLVLAVLMAVAAPSFIALRQRATLASVGEEVVGLWNQARLESAKRNSMVKVGYFVAGGGEYCIGAATTTSATDATPCDCTTAGACNVAVFPSEQKGWRGVTVNGTPTLGNNTGVAVIEPKRTTLTETGDAGAISFNGPPGQYSYRLNFRADRMARGVLCESIAATNPMPAFTERRCGP